MVPTALQHSNARPYSGGATVCHELSGGALKYHRQHAQSLGATVRLKSGAWFLKSVARPSLCGVKQILTEGFDVQLNNVILNVGRLCNS